MPDPDPPIRFESGEAYARELDAADALRPFRNRFELPRDPDGTPRVYLLGNSLGPLPTATRAAISAEVDAWAARGVESYFEPPRRWYEADERYRAAMAEVVGARTHEVAVMGGLTANLHFLFASFFRPDGRRTRVLMERAAFPSDRYVVDTQLAWHGLAADEHVMFVGDEDGHTEEAEIERLLTAHGDEIALVFLGGVNFLSGQRLDLSRITRAARAAGCAVGFDLAHAAGNVPLALHADGPDFAAWCTYKYLNSGPGAVAGLFVHERHACDPKTFRLGGWWGVDPDARFRMAEATPFRPRADAAGWQLSCPAVLTMAPLGPALAMFAEAGGEALRAKSTRLTAYLEWLLSVRVAEGALEALTPAEPDRRGAQLSYRVPGGAVEVQRALSARGVDIDLRDPDVIRLAPAPLFNSYHDAWRAARTLDEVLSA